MTSHMNSQLTKEETKKSCHSNNIGRPSADLGWLGQLGSLSRAPQAFHPQAGWGSWDRSVVPHKLFIPRLAGLGVFFTMTAKCKGATLAFVCMCVTMLTVNASHRVKPKSEGRHRKGLGECLGTGRRGGSSSCASSLPATLCLFTPLPWAWPHRVLCLDK